MLDYTKNAILKIVNDFKKFIFLCNVTTQIAYIAYLVYTLIAQTGLWFINLALLIISVSYLLFFLYATKKEACKQLKKRMNLLFKRCKQLVKFFTLGVMLYGIWQTTENVTPLSVILSALMIVGFVLQILFEVILKLLLNRADLILEGLKADWEQATKPVKSVGNFFKKLTGKEVEEEKEPTKNRALLDGLVAEDRARKEEERTQKKLTKREERLEKKRQKQEAKLVKKQAQSAPAPVQSPLYEEISAAKHENKS